MTSKSWCLEDGGSEVLRNVHVLPQHYTASQPRRWRQRSPPKRSCPTTTLHSVTTQKMEAAKSSEAFISYHTNIRHHNLEDGGSKVLRNVHILPQYYTVSQLRRWRQRSPSKCLYPTTTLHVVTTQKMEAAKSFETLVSYHNEDTMEKTLTCIFITLKTSNLAK
jgi:hypothetical protein